MENKVSLWLFVKIHCHKNYDISNFIQMALRTAVSLVRVTSVIVFGIYVYMYVTFPALNDNMTSKLEKAKWKTIDSFFTKPVSTETKDSSDKMLQQKNLFPKSPCQKELMTVNMQAQFRPYLAKTAPLRTQIYQVCKIPNCR